MGLPGDLQKVEFAVILFCTLSVTIPANTTAILVFPQGTESAVTEQGVDIGKSKTITSLTKEGNDLKVSVGSGSYEFVYGWK
jgi:alpha-L-rhamnosidase